MLGLLVFAVGVYLVGRDTKRQDMNQVIVHHDNVIQEKNRKIQGLEAQIIHMRKQAAEEFETIKARFDQSQRDLALVQRKLASAHQEIERLSLSRAAAVRPAPRSVNGSSTRPPGARPIAALQPRTYEALRPTSIYDEPLPSARIVAKLAKGTQVTVVSSENGWLEIRSKHGRPPGFIRKEAAERMDEAGARRRP